MGISSLDYSHPLIANSLAYAVHLNVLSNHQRALAAAVAYRFTVLSWSNSNRILDHLSLGLTRDQYYNLLRNSLLRKSDDSFKGLMAALNEGGFIFRIKLMP
jgi:hypothetical protein